MQKSVLLEELTWEEAEASLTEKTVVVLPLGAACKEHGKHLKLNNDFILAEYLKLEILKRSSVLIAPTISYSFYPAFVEYPGSISLRAETAAALIEDTCRSLANFGPSRFYVLNTGVSTLIPLQKAALSLKANKILLHYTDFSQALLPAAAELAEQEGGSHADEIETSIMLHIAPESVDMAKAAQDYDANAQGHLSRNRTSGLSYSPSGTWGNPLLASREKGQMIVKCLINNIVSDIELLRQADSF